VNTSDFWAAIKKQEVMHTANGHTVCLVQMSPASKSATLFVEKVAGGRRHGPVGIVLKLPLTELSVTQARDYLESTLDSLKAAGR
jgi:hypothetical protein